MYAFFYSNVTYVITAWGGAENSNINKLLNLNSHFFPLLGKGLLHFSPLHPVKRKLTPASAEAVHFISPPCFLSTSTSLLVAWNPFCDSLSPSFVVGSLNVTSPLPL